jgi:protein-disulfide isomerase
MTQQQRNLFVIGLVFVGVLATIFIFSARTTNPSAEGTLQTLDVAYQSQGENRIVRLTKLDRDVFTGSRFVAGSSSAKNTVVEFADYQCPACGLFATNTESLFEKEFIETGKVRYAFRDFPLPQHQNAKLAAQAASCANVQGRYQPFKNIMFRGQAAWSSSLESVARKQFGEYAASSGINLAQFVTCLNSNNAAEAVAADMTLASQIGVTSTPSFVVNGYLLAGALPIEAFRAILDKVGQ